MALTIAVLISFTGCLEIPETDSETYEGITWTYDFDRHIMTFSGRGEILDWDGVGGGKKHQSHYDIYHQVTKRIILNEGITSIGQNAFNNFSEISSITIPHSVKSLGHGAFYGCTRLTSVTIPNSVTIFDIFAFAYCSSLTAITIPNSVESIGLYAFTNCSSLKSITCKATTPPSISTYTFDHPENIDLYVPSGSVNAYKKDSSWGKFKSINAL